MHRPAMVAGSKINADDIRAKGIAHNQRLVSYNREKLRVIITSLTLNRGLPLCDTCIQGDRFYIALGSDENHL